jgi:2-polyprenyl-3-methyl-5-hydroxy-6-metoxy-1,4-benzoquinol methylase
MLALLDEELPDVRGLQILDLGCGTGRIARCFAARGACVTGVDFADKAIAIARTLSPGDNPRYEVGSMFALQGESLYDLIVSWGSIVFACRDAAQLRTVASSLRRLIRPGGRLLLLEPAHRGFVHRVLNLDQREFGEILKESGFDEIRVRQMHFWPVRFALAFVSWPNWITVPIYRLGQAVMNLSRNRWGGDYKAIFAVRT